ncbi:MAG: replication factor C large subunit, partial [Candidatus Diapherotrites archaeon]|nr:replication factor C large subunit [Candidatus Diapherotrites archaeon]
MESQLWVQTHVPKTFEAFVGNSELVREVSNWALEWSKGNAQKPLLLFGPPGCGKTLLVELTARLSGWHLFESNASDLRSKDAVEKVIGAASSNASFAGTYRMVLLDEIDQMQKGADRGGMSAVLAVLKEAKNPVILTANDIYENTQMSEIRNFCRKLEFKKPNYLSVARFLREVCEKEGIDFDSESILLLAKNASGDIRSALLDLQTICGQTRKITLSDVESIGVRERSERVFATVQKVFRSRTVADSQHARSATDADPDFLLRWIEENIPLEFPDSHERANAFERLSRADVFNGRIGIRQHYGFMRYSLELMTTGVALCHREPRHEFIMYKFPGLLRLLSASAGVRSMQKSLGKKVGKKMHSSSREFSSQDLPYWRQMFESKQTAIALCAMFNLAIEEIAFVSRSDAKSKTVSEIFGKSQALAQAFSSRRIASRVFAGPSASISSENSLDDPASPSEKPSDDSVSHK